MSSPAGNRRRADRRQADRRQPPSSQADDSWLSAWGDPSTSRFASRSGETSRFDTDLDAGSDSRFLAREAHRLVVIEGAALPRILRTYVAARAALALALVLAPWLAALMGSRPAVPVMLVCLAYAAQAVSLWLIHSARDDSRLPDHLLPRQWLWTIGIDLLAFSLLRLLDAAAQLNYTALLVLPVLMSGVLTRRLVALATAAGVTLVMLLGTLPILHDGESGGDLLLQLSQAGMAGAGMFLIALLASELSQRLAREERSARSSLELARQQTQLNRLVIEEMGEGVLVVDRRGRVRAINPAARALLGPAGQAMTVPSPLSDEPALHVLLQALEQAYVQGSWPAAARELTLLLDDDEQRTLQVRARFTRRAGIAADDTPPEDICVLFLEDMRAVQGRARQDKLAAMGRVSAGIAHEIRNPLAAISQANALMLEDALLPPQRRLSRIVADNVERLKRIVDDVLAVAPGAAVPTTAIDARAEVAQVIDDWRRSAGPASRAAERLAVDLPATALRVQFDTEHLRRVLVNLLDNASRHASKQAGAVQVRLAPGPAVGQVTLTVASDGAPIPHDVEHRLFEPFFSTRSRGSGLGLYICRELCERHGASIDFHPAPASARHRNVFGVAMRQTAPS
jgi:two-component system sensor histidine kinase PilS (NtrC family)